MNELTQSLFEFLLTPAFRWIILALRIIIGLLLYINEPQRFSYVTAIDGLSYKWHLYYLAMISAIATFLTFLGMWLTIPFSNSLPEYWYIPLFIIYFAIITQITISTEQIQDDGSFNPPPTYLLPLKYRMILSYVAFILDVIIFAQVFIYFGVADYSKKTILSRYILERFGGWYPGNKLDFIFDWLGVLELVYRIYILYLQYNFTACAYGLPSSWNF
jgi:hypothetical protein